MYMTRVFLLGVCPYFSQLFFIMLIDSVCFLACLYLFSSLSFFNSFYLSAFNLFYFSKIHRTRDPVCLLWSGQSSNHSSSYLQACREKIKGLQSKITAFTQRMNLINQRGTPDEEEMKREQKTSVNHNVTFQDLFLVELFSFFIFLLVLYYIICISSSSHCLVFDCTLHSACRNLSVISPLSITLFLSLCLLNKLFCYYLFLGLFQISICINIHEQNCEISEI